jgi:hypothetical protein
VTKRNLPYLQHVSDHFGESDDAHGAGDGVCETEYQTDRSAELRSQRSRYHIIRSAAFDLAVRRYGAHAERRDRDDDRADQNDQRSESDPRDAGHPTYAKVKHRAQYAQDASHLKKQYFIIDKDFYKKGDRLPKLLESNRIFDQRARVEDIQPRRDSFRPEKCLKFNFANAHL